jgi:hypothetical protein
VLPPPPIRDRLGGVARDFKPASSCRVSWTASKLTIRHFSGTMWFTRFVDIRVSVLPGWRKTPLACSATTRTYLYGKAMNSWAVPINSFNKRSEIRSLYYMLPHTADRSSKSRLWKRNPHLGEQNFTLLEHEWKQTQSVLSNLNRENSTTTITVFFVWQTILPCASPVCVTYEGFNCPAFGGTMFDARIITSPKSSTKTFKFCIVCQA